MLTLMLNQLYKSIYIHVNYETSLYLNINDSMYIFSNQNSHRGVYQKAHNTKGRNRSNFKSKIKTSRPFPGTSVSHRYRLVCPDNKTRIRPGTGVPFQRLSRVVKSSGARENSYKLCRNMRVVKLVSAIEKFEELACSMWIDGCSFEIWNV